MSELAALQARFGAVLDARVIDEHALELFAGESAAVRERFAVYRGNSKANAAKAMAAAYPVIGKIVGEEFFSGLVSEYQSRFASFDGDLHEYGEAFAPFLDNFPPAKAIPYLADVARLEWCVHRAHYAADPEPFDLARLAAVPAERQLQLRPCLHPACHVLRSDYPIARIWEVHQGAFSGGFDVDFSRDPAHALVFRPRFRVEVAQTSDAEAAFLAAALHGQTLEVALVAAQSCNASFDLGPALNEWVRTSVIVDFKLDAE